MRKADQGVHERQLARVIQLQARYALAGGQDRGSGEFSQLFPVNEGFQYILLDVLVVMVDGGELLAQLGKVSTDFLTP
jgi:hypothetical protein